MVSLVRRYNDEDIIDRAQNDQDDYLFDGLSQHILTCFDRASSHRAEHGVDNDIVNSMRAYKAKYSSEELAKFEGIAVYRGLTGMLCRTAESWLEDAYLMVEDKPWTLSPTPKPELPRTIRDALDQAIEARLVQLSQSGVVLQTEQDRYDVVRALRDEAERMAHEEATKALTGMDKVISDQLAEGNWRIEFAKFRHDVMIYPTAIVKAGTYRNVQRAVWNGDEMESVLSTIKVVERVSPIDMFPSPDSTTTQDGEYLIERMRMSRSALVQCIGLPYFFEEALRLVLYDFPEGVSETSDNRMAWLQATDGDDSSTYIVYDFHGRVSGETILSFYDAEDDSDEAMREGGVVDTDIGEIDPMGTYEINAWLCGGKVVRLLMAPNPMNTRPYYASSYCKVPGSFWGMGIPQLIEGLQHELNSAARSRVFNLGIASGPIVEIDVDRLDNEDRPEQIEPWRIFFTNGSAGAGHAPAVRFNQANMHVEQLTRVMDETWTKGHDIAGLPPYTRGVNEGAARTLGAFSMQYDSATKGIKRVMGNIDRDVIEPLITDYYYDEMFHGDDPSVKADAQVVARGTVGLLRKENAEAKPLETLMQIQGFAERYPTAIDALILEFFKERGYNPEQLGMQPGLLQGALGPQSNAAPNTPPDMGAPMLDGRSAPAQQSIDNTVIR